MYSTRSRITYSVAPVLIPDHDSSTSTPKSSPTLSTPHDICLRLVQFAARMEDVRDPEMQREMGLALLETYRVAHLLLTRVFSEVPTVTSLESLNNTVETLRLYAQRDSRESVDSEILKSLSDSVDDLFVGVDNCVRVSGWIHTAPSSSRGQPS